GSMSRSTQLKGWSRGAVVALVLASGWSLRLATTCAGAGPASQAPCDIGTGKIYTNKSIFHLPVKIDERVRDSLREVCLFVKANGGPWVRKEAAPPTQSHFTYQVGPDGEYWFSVVTVDKTGTATPSDVSKEPPGLMVVVDTQPPTLDVQPLTGPGESGLRCIVQDANP